MAGEPRSLKPSTSTVVSGAIGIPLGIVVVWVIKILLPENLELPIEVASAIGSLVAAIVGLFGEGGRSDDLPE